MIHNSMHRFINFSHIAPFVFVLLAYLFCTEFQVVTCIACSM